MGLATCLYASNAKQGQQDCSSGPAGSSSRWGRQTSRPAGVGVGLAAACTSPENGARLRRGVNAGAMADATLCSPPRSAMRSMRFQVDNHGCQAAPQLKPFMRRVNLGSSHRQPSTKPAEFPLLLSNLHSPHSVCSAAYLPSVPSQAGQVPCTLQQIATRPPCAALCRWQPDTAQQAHLRVCF